MGQQNRCLGAGPEPSPSGLRLAGTLQLESLPSKPWHEREMERSLALGAGAGLAGGHLHRHLVQQGQARIWPLGSVLYWESLPFMVQYLNLPTHGMGLP